MSAEHMKTMKREHRMMMMIHMVVKKQRVKAMEMRTMSLINLPQATTPPTQVKTLIDLINAFLLMRKKPLHISLHWKLNTKTL